VTLIFFTRAYPDAMEFRIRYGPWALVTGSSSGLGAEFARQLGRRGLNLILVARRLDRLEHLAGQLRHAERVETRVIAADLTDPAAVARLEQETAGLDLGLLVNNAGIGWSGAFLQQDPEALARMVRLNCEAPAVLARRLLPRIAARGSGGMILVASAAGYQPTPWMSVYGATKGFALLLGEALAQELREKGVDVLTVSPGHTESEFHAIAGVSDAVVGGAARPEDVVRETLERLGSCHSFVHGWHNKALIWGGRWVTRRMAARISARLLAARLRRSTT
jgi:short-subunit dehydrogenase